MIRGPLTVSEVFMQRRLETWCERILRQLPKRVKDGIHEGDYSDWLFEMTLRTWSVSPHSGLRGGLNTGLDYWAGVFCLHFFICSTFVRCIHHVIVHISMSLLPYYLSLEHHKCYTHAGGNPQFEQTYCQIWPPTLAPGIIQGYKFLNWLL